MRITFGPRNLMALAYIAQNMRGRDAAECLATASATPDALAAATFALGDVQWVVWKGAEPVASIGAVLVWPGVWNAWAWATDRWPEVVLSVTRHVRRVAFPALVKMGAHRIQAASLATHADAHAWLRRLGAQPEGTLRGFGRGGEDFIMFAWRR